MPGKQLTRRSGVEAATLSTCLHSVHRAPVRSQMHPAGPAASQLFRPTPPHLHILLQLRFQQRAVIQQQQRLLRQVALPARVGGGAAGAKHTQLVQVKAAPAGEGRGLQQWRFVVIAQVGSSGDFWKPQTAIGKGALRQQPPVVPPCSEASNQHA